MNQLQRNAIAGVAMTRETVEDIYEGKQSGTDKQCLKALCESHERLRAELRGAEALLFEEPGKAALGALLTACKETVSALRSLNDHEKVCRELIAAKAENGDDMAIILSNVMRHLDSATEAVEQSLSPRGRHNDSDFEAWLRETFLHRDMQTREGSETGLKMEAVPYAHVFNYEQAIHLATFIWQQMENKRPPWWSKYRTAENAAKALALTDTGSDAFRESFPPESYAPRDHVPGWRVIEKIREALLGTE